MLDPQLLKIAKNSVDRASIKRSFNSDIYEDAVSITYQTLLNAVNSKTFSKDPKNYLITTAFRTAKRLSTRCLQSNGLGSEKSSVHTGIEDKFIETYNLNTSYSEGSYWDASSPEDLLDPIFEAELELLELNKLLERVYALAKIETYDLFPNEKIFVNKAKKILDYLTNNKEIRELIEDKTFRQFSQIEDFSESLVGRLERIEQRLRKAGVNV